LKKKDQEDATAHRPLGPRHSRAFPDHQEPSGKHGD
jgi:hypothetical protein